MQDEPEIQAAKKTGSWCNAADDDNPHGEFGTAHVGRDETVYGEPPAFGW